MLNSLHTSTFGHATMSEIGSFLRVKEDKRRELLRSWELSGRQTLAWSELWSAIGLDPPQDESLWNALKLPLLLPPDVAPMVGISVETLNAWCRTDTLPTGFPPPICVGPRKKLWIHLDILARRQPEIYADAAGKINRSRPQWQLPERPNITLDPDLSITTLRKNSSVEANLANVEGIETGTDGFMLADIEELIANINAAEDSTYVAESPMMDRVLSMLDQEIEADAASSPRVLAKTALLDLSRFDAAPLIAFTATKETEYGTETDGRIPQTSATCHSSPRRRGVEERRGGWRLWLSFFKIFNSISGKCL